MGNSMDKIKNNHHSKRHTPQPRNVNASSSRNTGGQAYRPPPAAAPNVPAPAGPFISLDNMSSATMSAMLSDLAAAVPGQDAYRVIGGVAAAQYGSDRGTKDLDLLVPGSNYVAYVVGLLVGSGNFEAVDRGHGNYQVWYKSRDGKNYNVDIIEPSKIYQSLQFPTSVKSSTGPAIIGRADLLNLKVLAYLLRKKANDAMDILFIVREMAMRRLRTSPREVPFADGDFLLDFVTQKYASSKNNWVAIGLPPP